MGGGNLIKDSFVIALEKLIGHSGLDTESVLSLKSEDINLQNKTILVEMSIL